MKIKKSKSKNQNYIIFNAIFGCAMLIMAGALIFFSANYKTHFDQEILDLKDHLLSSHIEMMYGKEGSRVCQMESYGISQDNDVYVHFWCQDYDADTHEPSSDKAYHTLYFQHPITKDGITDADYAEALGD